MLLDPEQKIARPRQIYLGYDTRHYVPMDQRHETPAHAAPPPAKHS
jgi:citrate synthase